MTDLQQLQARVQRLDDIKKIEHLQKIYGYYQDYGEWEKIVDLFTDNNPSVEEATAAYTPARRAYADTMSISSATDRAPATTGYHEHRFPAPGRRHDRTRSEHRQRQVVRHGDAGKTHRLAA